MIDKGLLLFGFIIGIITIMAAVFASNVIPSIFRTQDVVISFNQSQLQLVNKLDATLQEVHTIAEKSKQQSTLNVQMTKINAKNIQNIMNNISAINAKINNK